MNGKLILEFDIGELVGERYMEKQINAAHERIRMILLDMREGPVEVQIDGDDFPDRPIWINFWPVGGGIWRLSLTNRKSHFHEALTGEIPIKRLLHITKGGQDEDG